MRNVNEIENRIAFLVVEISLGRLTLSEILPQHTILGDLELDSLDFATVMLGCEEWLQCKVDEGGVNWRDITTVHELAVLLERSQR